MTSSRDPVNNSAVVMVASRAAGKERFKSSRLYYWLPVFHTSPALTNYFSILYFILFMKIILIIIWQTNDFAKETNRQILCFMLWWKSENTTGWNTIFFLCILIGTFCMNDPHRESQGSQSVERSCRFQVTNSSGHTSFRQICKKLLFHYND